MKKNTYRNYLLLVVLTTFFISSSTSQTFRNVRPETVGMSSDRLERLTHQLESYVESKKSSIGMKKMKLDTIAIPTGVKGIIKYTDRNASVDSSSILTTFKKGAPVHVKASISYNDLIKYFKLGNKYNFISYGEKIKWVYLKNNNFGLDTIAYKGYEDPPQILEFIKEYVNFDKIYSAILKKKIKMFYDTMKWGQHVDKGESIERFF